jgi:CRP/FNR family transcriptional regulator, anaerobic regulatory protein
VDLHVHSRPEPADITLSNGLLADLGSGRRRLKGGQRLFGDGDPFTSLYGVSSGFFKTAVLDAGGHAQVIGFFIPGDLIGLEGVGQTRHGATAIALEDSEAVVLPYALIEARSREDRAFQRLIHVALARDIGNKQSLMLLLGSMRAEERLAFFLLELSSRYQHRGYSPGELRLPMTREDIGSYLGMTLETVSRLFTRFQKCRIIDVRQRRLKLLDFAGLRRLAGASAG